MYMNHNKKTMKSLLIFLTLITYTLSLNYLLADSGCSTDDDYITTEITEDSCQARSLSSAQDGFECCLLTFKESNGTKKYKCLASKKSVSGDIVKDFRDSVLSGVREVRLECASSKLVASLIVVLCLIVL